MSYQVKQKIASLVTNLVVFSWYYLRAIGIYEERSMSSAEEFKFWAQVILILIPVLVVSQIVVQILFAM